MANWKLTFEITPWYTIPPPSPEPMQKRQSVTRSLGRSLNCPFWTGMGLSTRVLKDLRSAHSHFLVNPKLSFSHGGPSCGHWRIVIKKWFRITPRLCWREREVGYYPMDNVTATFGSKPSLIVEEQQFKLVRFLLLKCHPLQWNGMASIGKRFYCLFFGLVWKQIQQEQEYIFLTWFCEEKEKKSAETDFLHLDLGLPPHPLLCTLLHLLHLGVNLGCCTFTITNGSGMQGAAVHMFSDADDGSFLVMCCHAACL